MHSKNKKIILIMLILSIFTVSIVSADTTHDITVSLSFYGPYWDIDHDGIVNYLDVSSLVSHYGDTVPPRPRYDGDYRWDITGDGIVNYLDVSLMVSHYGEVWLA